MIFMKDCTEKMILWYLLIKVIELLESFNHDQNGNCDQLWFLRSYHWLLWSWIWLLLSFITAIMNLIATVMKMITNDHLTTTIIRMITHKTKNPIITVNFLSSVSKIWIYFRLTSSIKPTKQKYDQDPRTIKQTKKLLFFDWFIVDRRK